MSSELAKNEKSKAPLSNKMKFRLFLFFIWYLFATYIIGKNTGVLLYIVDNILELKNYLLGIPVVIIAFIALERYFDKRKEKSGLSPMSFYTWLIIGLISLATFFLLKQSLEVWIKAVIFYAPLMYMFYVTLAVEEEIQSDEKRLTALMKEKEGCVNE